MSKNIQILIINGPNLNKLGEREPEIYGSETLDDINKKISSFCSNNAVTPSFYQSNHEGDIVDKIQSIKNSIDAIIINPAAYTHTSIAIRDALNLLNIPIIEVHLSNIYARETFRHHSFSAPICLGQIAGFGSYGYSLAILAIINHINKNKSA